MSYEQALSAARTAPLTVPSFATIADAAARARTVRLREDGECRTRAARWFWVSAALWLLLPLDALVLPLLGITGATWPTVWGTALDVMLMALPPALISIWGARLTRDDRRFRSAMLARAIATSNLIVALLYAASVGGMFGAVFTSLLALGSARSLALLGDRGLDGSEDPGGEFKPIRFRKLLIVALIMAFADVLTLAFSSSVVGVMTLGFALAGRGLGISMPLALTVAAALLMAINVWGLLRLRVWALFGTLLSNLGIAVLALQGMLAINIYVSTMLAVTAAVQLLLLVPILAAALGDDQAGQADPAHERLGKLVRLIVPVLVIATIIMALINFGPALPRAWSIPRWPS